MKVEEIQRLHVDQLERSGWLRRRPVAAGPAVVDLAAITLFWLLFFWAILVRRSHFIPYDLLDQHYMFQAFIHHALYTGASRW